MIKSVLIVFFIASSLISTAYTADNDRDKEMLTMFCKKNLAAIKGGYFEKGYKAIEECREKVLSKDAYAAVVKCNDLLPMKTAELVTKNCADIDGNLAKFGEMLKCTAQSVGSDNFDKFRDCCKKMDEAGESKST